jgi:15-cis-phytoene synthase
MVTGAPTTADAYRECERLTRAATDNPYHAIRLLPRRKRRAMCAVYAFARRVEDIGEGPLEVPEKLRRLDEVREALGALRAGAPARAPRDGERPEGHRLQEGAQAPRDFDPADGHGLPAEVDLVMMALASAHARFDLPLQALDELIAGVRMDVESTNYESFEDLLLYCRRVAGSIGRLCVAIFGSRDPRAAVALADDLGVALRLANIARDLREDAERGHVYLPAQELVRYHLHDDGALDATVLARLTREGTSAQQSVIEGMDGGDVGQLYALMRFQVMRSRDWFHRGLPLVLLLDRRSAACTTAMIGTYMRLGKRIEQRPDGALAARTTLSARQKAWVVARALLRPRRVPEQHPAERLS